MDKKKIYIVLTRSNTILSNLIHMISQDDYTHAALALDKDLKYMFSFGRRYPNNPFIGCFRKERLDQGYYARSGKLPGAIIELRVTKAEHDQVIAMIQHFMQHSSQYKYNYMGLINNLLGIQFYNKNRFLCSEFVYHVLHQCHVCDFGISRSLVRPQDFLNIEGRVLYQGDLKQYNRSEFVIPSAVPVLVGC